MKKVFAISLVSLLLVMIALPVAAQDAPPKNLIKINLLSPLVRTGSFFFERAMTDEISLQLGFFYTGASIGETKFRGFGLTPELRYYLSEKYPAPRGVFIAPFARYQNFTLTDDLDNEGTYSSFGGGLLVGTQTMFKNKISLDVWAGPAYSSGKTKVTDGEDTFDLGSFDGFGVRFGVTVGFGF
jgi:hypothetical protein